MIARWRLWLILVVLVLVLSACAPAAPAPQPTQPPAPTAVPAEPTAVPATATLAPTATLPPTATSLPPTATVVPPTATAAVQTGLSASWCILRDNAFNVKAAAPDVMPDGARPGVEANGSLTLLTPSTTCTLVFSLPTAAIQGAVLEVLDGSNAVWLKAPLQVSSSNPNQAYAVLKHSYVVEPPYWTIFYPMRLKGADGAELWKAQVEMRYYWQPEKCWDGTMPNIKTLACKKQQDLHPWDPAYTPPPPGQ